MARLTNTLHFGNDGSRGRDPSRLAPTAPARLPRMGVDIRAQAFWLARGREGVRPRAPQR